MLNTGGSHRTANSTPHQQRGTSSNSASVVVPANADELQQHLQYVVCTAPATTCLSAVLSHPVSFWLIRRARGDVGVPLSRAALSPHVPEQLPAVLAALTELVSDGMALRQIARALLLLAEEREAGQRMSDRVQLVWSPPDLDAVDARDTAVVVQELFRRAQSSALISTFALDEKKKAEVLFGELATRMAETPSLSVRVFANIHRKRLEATPAAVLVREFAARIRRQVWPRKRLPEVFYDPRSLDTDLQQRAVLHAKAVVIDGRYTLLTSANFTEAAQERNIEAGVLLDDPRLAARVTRQLDHFVQTQVLRRVPL